MSGFVEMVVGEAGRLDVSFDLISVGDVQGTPLVEMEWADFMQPIETAVRSNFLTVKAAVPHMVRGGGGAVLFFGGGRDPVPNHSIGGFQVELHAVEAMRRQYASELGSVGVRFVTLRTGGVPDTLNGVGAVPDWLTHRAHGYLTFVTINSNGGAKWLQETAVGAASVGSPWAASWSSSGSS